MDSPFVTHNQLLIIILIILLGVGIYSYAMLKHAIELRQRTTQVIEDLAVVQGVIDTELIVDLAEQQLAIDAISLVQQAQGINLSNLNTNSGISLSNFNKIKTAGKFGLGGLGDVTVSGWQEFPVI